MTQEKAKVQEIKKLIEEREEMQEKINSILDQNVPDPPKRPQTAAPKRAEIKSDLFPEIFDIESINCKICKFRPVEIQINEFKYEQFTPFSLSGNPHSQNLLTNYLVANGMTLQQVYDSVVNSLSKISIKKIHEDCKTAALRPTDSACSECIYEFAEN